MEDKLKSLLTDIPNPERFSLRFPVNLIHSGSTGELSKFCIFLVKNRGIGNKQNIFRYIALPIPEQLDDTVNVSYNSSSFGAVGAAVVGTARGFINSISGDNLKETGEVLTNSLKRGLSSFNKELSYKVAAGLALKGSPQIKAAINQSALTIENPFMSSTFSGVGFREFSFNFNLVPKNSNDSTALKNIIQAFKASMMPIDKLLIERSKNDLLVQNTGVQKMPDLFDITFYPTTNFSNKNSSKNLPKIRDAVLTKFEVNHSTETSTPVFYEETNAPATTSISLSFKETVVYTRERCEEDYKEILRSVD